MTDSQVKQKLRLTLLGGFELCIDGELVPVQPSAQRVLAFVALAARGVERSFAAMQLWPDKREERAKANLRASIWRIGKLSGDLIDTRGTRLHLCPNVWVDTQDGIPEVASVEPSSFSQSCLPFQTLNRALLPDWYDGWLVVEREHLRQLQLGALEQRARSALQAGRSHDAIQAALSAASLDPLRESAHRIVIEAHLAEFNGAEAASHFERYRQLLWADTGLTPSADLAQVVAQLRPPQGRGLPVDPLTSKAI